MSWLLNEYNHIVAILTFTSVLQNAVKKTIIPTEYLGVKLVSFGFAGQGRAIMRGPMVSGVINQLLTTTEWYEKPHRLKHNRQYLMDD